MVLVRISFTEYISNDYVLSNILTTRTFNLAIRKRVEISGRHKLERQPGEFKSRVI